MGNELNIHRYWVTVQELERGFGADPDEVIKLANTLSEKYSLNNHIAENFGEKMITSELIMLMVCNTDSEWAIGFRSNLVAILESHRAVESFVVTGKCMSMPEGNS